MTTTVLAYIPSPAQGVWQLGPVPLRAYALFIIAGIIAALLIGDRRWVARGGEPGVIYDVVLWAVPFGLIGGRLYHVITDWQKYFGEGGAGTWSDGKLTTRIGRNSGDVRAVLRTFVRHGAPAEILTQGAPHLGTDGLIGILKSLRGQLTELGVDLRFGTRLLGLETEDGACVGVRVLGEAGEATLKADAVVCAAGHSADDVYDALEAAGAKLEVKPVAVGFRVEHPQAFVNAAQYGDELAKNTDTTGRGYGLPAAIAAKLADRQRPAVCFAGDGCFLMTCQELATAAQVGARPVILILNNGIYGTIRAHQERNYPARVSGTDMTNPDFAALARAYGAHGETVTKTADFEAA